MDPWNWLWSVQWPRHMICEKEEKLNETWEEVSKCSSALLSRMTKIFIDSSNVKFVIDSTLHVSSITNFHHWTSPWIHIIKHLWRTLKLFCSPATNRRDSHAKFYDANFNSVANGGGGDGILSIVFSWMAKEQRGDAANLAHLFNNHYRSPCGNFNLRSSRSGHEVH